MREELENAKKCIDNAKKTVEERIEDAEHDSNMLMILLNYKIELADIQYRLKDMLTYLPNVEDE